MDVVVKRRRPLSFAGQSVRVVITAINRRRSEPKRAGSHRVYYLCHPRSSVIICGLRGCSVAPTEIMRAIPVIKLAESVEKRIWRTLIAGILMAVVGVITAALKRG